MNIYDIAREAGVSIATVSRVINGGSVKKETRKLVESVIAENNFVPSAVARNLSGSDNCNIGVLIPDIANPFFAMVLSGISYTAEQLGYNVFLFGTDESTDREHRVLQTVKRQRLRGLIAIAVSSDDEETQRQLNELNADNIPIVLIDRDVKNTNFDRVFSDDLGGSYRAVKALIEAGHERIATIYGPKTSRPGIQRFDGYMKAMQEAKLPIREEYILPGDFRQHVAHACMERLLALPEPPTAVFSSNNLTTQGCLQCFKEHDIVVGRDISIIGFDEIEALQYVNFNLSVVDRPVYEMGREAINMLQMRIKEGAVGTFAHHRIVLDTQLILRGSEKLSK